MATFEVRSPSGGAPYKFSLVNAHLLFGGDGRRERRERENEFNALTDWMLERVASTRSHHRDYILLGDLNLAFDEAEDKRRAEIIERIKSMNATLTEREAATVVNFPFIDPRRDPRTGEVRLIRTNARQDQTFDQIAIFAKDGRLPDCEANPGVAICGVGHLQSLGTFRDDRICIRFSRSNFSYSPQKYATVSSSASPGSRPFACATKALNRAVANIIDALI
jgi:hypothetical protein